MYLVKGDEVVIISGKDKNKRGTITKVMREENKVIVENLNMVTKHVKAQSGSEGGITQKEAPINASNVMLIDPSTNQRTRVGFENKDGKKIRVSKKSNKEIKKEV